jgi:hypothetical protein
VRAAYAKDRREGRGFAFFSDMAARIAGAHLVISRSGASTVSEIAVIGRPSLLVPYPYALDHDQAANAAALAKAGGARCMCSRRCRPAACRLLASAMDDPARLTRWRGGQDRRETGCRAVARRPDRGYCVRHDSPEDSGKGCGMKMPQTSAWCISSASAASA